MNFLLDILLVLVVMLISGPGMIMLLWLAIFESPSPLDGLPDPADKNEADL